VVVTGEYPPEEQVVGYAQVRYGYGGGRQKQVRSLQGTTDDGAVPIWDQVHDGNTTDVATVIETMEALREHVRCSDFVLVGDSKLLSETNRRALLAAGVGYLAPLARSPELDAAFLAIPPHALLPLDYVSAREASLPPEERTTYHGFATSVEVVVAVAEGGERRQQLQRLFVLSSEERAASLPRRRRGRHRARQRDRAETEIAKIVARVGSRWYPTAERARAKIETILEQRHLTDLYRVTCGEVDGQPTVTCDLGPAALARLEALDGYYVLETTRSAEEATPSALLAQWKGQWQIEHRHRSAKGPLRVRPLFVTRNQRIVGLITILGIALMVFSLLERAARRALGPLAKVPNLLAGDVAARPTGDNLLKALRTISLVTLELAGTPHRAPSALTPLHRTLLQLLSVSEDAYARLAA
jgi:transposase